MSDENLTVFKWGQQVPYSEEQMAFSQAVAESTRRWMHATPAERAAWRAEAAAERAAERDAANRVPLTVDALADRMGWSREYAEHLVQPYCECEEESYGGGWSYCQHARDLGLAG